MFAAGDAVRTRNPGEAHGIRRESFTAAGRQGEVAAHTALGQDDVFADVPWWWSDQYDATVQAIAAEARLDLAAAHDAAADLAALTSVLRAAARGAT